MILNTKQILLSSIFLCYVCQSTSFGYDWVYYQHTNHWYALSKAGTWQECEQEAITLGGHLVAIRDSIENQWIVDVFNYPGWIGISDAISEGTWYWSNGEPVNFTRWNSGEPNNYGNEDYGRIYNYTNDPRYPPGTWNDQPGHIVIRGIMEVEQLPDLKTGLIAYWNFDEGEGSAAHDTSGNANHGTIYGASWVDGVHGKALSFDGVDDYVRVPDSPELNFGTDDFSVSLFVRLESITTQGEWPGAAIINKRWTEDDFYTKGQNQWMISYAIEDYFHFWTWSQSYSGVYTEYGLDRNKLYHVVGVRQDNNMYLYLNGKLASSDVSEEIRNVSTPMDLFIGVDGRSYLINNAATNYLHGLIDEVRIYNRALSESEIQELYGSSIDSGLVGYWSFDEGEGDIAYDESGNCNDGTIHGATYRDGVVGGALSFDGEGDGVLIPDDPTLHFGIDPFTFCMWIEPSTFCGNECGISSGVRLIDKAISYPSTWWVVDILQDGRTELEMGDSEGVLSYPRSDGKLLLNTWQHISIVCDRDLFAATFYLDGVQCGTKVLPDDFLGSLDVPEVPIDIGSSRLNGFQGLIDEVRIYNRALSETEIRALASINPPSTTTAEVKKFGNLTISADSILKREGNDSEYDITGNILINDILHVDGQIYANTNSGVVRGEGQIWLDIPDLGNIMLHNGAWEFDGYKEACNALNGMLSQLDVAGMKVRCTDLSFADNTLKIQGFADMPEKLGGGKIDIQGDHYIGYSLENGLIYDFTVEQELNLDVGGCTFTAKDSYAHLYNTEGPGICKIYGVYTLSDFLDGIEVNLDVTQGNYFSVTSTDGKVEVDIVGSIYIGEITLTPGIYGKELYLDMDTVNQNYYASGTIGFPVCHTQVIADGQFWVVGGYFDGANIDAEFYPPFAILYSPTPPPVPIVYLNSVGAGIYNLSPLSEKEIIIQARAGLTGGPEFNGYSLMTLDLTGTLDLSGSIRGDAVLHIGNLGNGNSVLDGNATILIDLNNGVYLALSISKSYKNEEFIYLGGKAFIGFEKNVAGSLKGMLRIPTKAPVIGALAGGQELSAQAYVQASDDGEDNNDYAAVGFTYVVNYLFGKANLKHAIEINLANGDIDWTGSWDRILDITIPDTAPGEQILYPPPPSEMVIAPDLDYAIFRVSWERNTTELSLRRPDGQEITTQNYQGFSNILYRTNDDPLEAFYIIDSPMAGVWNMSVSNKDIGAHTFQVFRESQSPTIAIVEPSVSTGTSPVNITWTAVDTDDNAQISLFYDTDHQGNDGTLITEALSEGTDEAFLWDTTGIPTGEYYVYAVISDGKNLPAVSYSTGKVIVVDPAAPLPPEDLTASPTGETGEIRVTWSPSPLDNVDHYNVHYSSDPVGETMEEVRGAGNRNSIILTNLVPGETYRIAVSSVDPNNIYGALSEPILVVLTDDQNHVPTFTGAIPTQAAVDQFYGFQVLSEDMDSDPVHHSFVLDDPNIPLPPDGMTLSAEGFLEWIPTTIQLGNHTFGIQLDDGYGGINRKEFTIFVGDENTGNRPPEILSKAPPIGYLGETYTYPLIAIDPEGGSLVYELLVAPEGATVNAGGIIQWAVPTEALSGRYESLVKVRDPQGLFEIQRFYVQIDNEAPLLDGVNWGTLTAINPNTTQVDVLPISDATGFVLYQLDVDGTPTEWQELFKFNIDSLTPNTEHSFMVKAMDPIGNETALSLPITGYTQAQVPPAPVTDSVSLRAIELHLDQGTNPDETELALWSASLGKWISLEGQMVEEPVWATVATWGTISVGDLSMDTTYAFQAKARNQESLETELGGTLSVKTLAPDSEADVQADREWIYAYSDTETGTVNMTAQFVNDPFENTLYTYHWQPLKNTDETKLRVIDGGGLSDDFANFIAPAAVEELPAVYQVRCTITGFPQGNSVSRTIDIEVKHSNADFDNDGDTDIDDLIIMAQQWLAEGDDLTADISPAEKDNIVNMQDLAELGKWWMME